MEQDIDIVKRAKAFAHMAHRGQKYGEHNYTFHLLQAVRVLKEHGFTNKYLAAGWLHDYLEDTPDASLPLLQAEFGNEIAELVFAVTDEPGENRRERHAKTYPKIKAVPGAVVIKLADRIANVEFAWASRDPRLFMYRKEYGGFREALQADDASRTVLAMWDRLDKLMGWMEWDINNWARRERR